MGRLVRLVRRLAMAALLLTACGGSRDRGGHDAAPAPPAPTDAAPAPANAAHAPADAAPAPANAAHAPADAAAPPTDSAQPAGPKPVLVVTATPPRPGTSSTTTLEIHLDFDLNLGTYKTVTSTQQSKIKRIEIVAVDPDGTVHKRITFTRHVTNAVVDGERKKDTSPLPGKTFLVTWNDSLTDVRRADGKPASTEEAEAVRKEEVLLQSPEIMGKALAGLRLVEDQPFEVPAATLAKLTNGAYHPRRLVLVYRGKRGGAARIDAEAALANDGAGLKMYLDLKAELAVDATGLCLSADITGQIRAEFNGTVVGSGAGKATIRTTPFR